MTSQIKPLKLYGGNLGPNPSKVALVCAALEIPYEPIEIPFSEIKSDAYTKINPNGRLPAIEDPNTGITLWESGAIIEYLISKYDPKYKFSFPAESAEGFHTKQWLYFQVSGQGPYYGQSYWFTNSHPEKLPSAIERFNNEIKRVTGVLNKALDGKTFLVGEKCTYADLSFITWQASAAAVLPKEVDLAKEFPNVQAWLERMQANPAVKKSLEEAAENMAEARKHMKK